MVYYYMNTLVLIAGSGFFLSQMQLQLPGLKRTEPEQNSSIIAELMKASTLLYRAWKGKADVYEKRGV